MHPYNEETKAKFGKALKKGGAKFHKAMEEIENNFEVSPEAEPEPEEPELVPVRYLSSFIFFLVELVTYYFN